MNDLLYAFYERAERLTGIFNLLHTCITDVMGYDPTFTSVQFIERMKSGDLDSIFNENQCYNYLFDVLRDFVDRGKVGPYHMLRIIDSEELDDGDPIYGDYDFYTGKIYDDLVFLYMWSSHRDVYPDRITFYGPDIQVSCNASQPEIAIYPVNIDIKHRILTHDVSKRMELVREWLRNTDRPTVDKAEF